MRLRASGGEDKALATRGEDNPRGILINYEIQIRNNSVLTFQFL